MLLFIFGTIVGTTLGIGLQCMLIVAKESDTKLS